MGEKIMPKSDKIWEKLMEIAKVFVENSEGRAELICQKSYEKYEPDKYFIIIDGQKKVPDLEYFFPNDFLKYIHPSRAETLVFSFINASLENSLQAILKLLEDLLPEIHPDPKNSLALGLLDKHTREPK